MLEAAAANHFVPGALLSENAAGTNAIGTTLYLDHPLQIFSAEHFNSLFHGWTCSAAPIHDPVTGVLLGAIDLSGNFRTAHPHSVSLVTAVARLVETRLALVAARRDAHLRDRYLALVMRVPAAERARDDVGPRAGREPAVVARREFTLPAGADRFTLPSGDEVALEPLENGEAFLLWKVDRARPVPSRPTLGSSRSAGRERRWSRSAGRSS